MPDTIEAVYEVLICFRIEEQLYGVPSIFLHGAIAFLPTGTAVYLFGITKAANGRIRLTIMEVPEFRTSAMATKVDATQTSPGADKVWLEFEGTTYEADHRAVAAGDNEYIAFIEPSTAALTPASQWRLADGVYRPIEQVSVKRLLRAKQIESHTLTIPFPSNPAAN